MISGQKIKKTSITKRPLPRRNSQSKPDWPMLPYETMNLEIDSQWKNKCKNSAGIRLWYFYPYRPRAELRPRLYSYYFWLWKRNVDQTTDRQIHQRLAVTRYELQRFSCRMGWDEKKHYNGELTDDEFEDWKLPYPKKSRFLRKSWLTNNST